tara:strand:+ start:164 stop:487 length:324 start_codon:yes stop_codon:yes gene_type:complete
MNPRHRNSNNLSCKPINKAIEHEKREAIKTPPIKPSTVFPGLILGNKGVFPIILPTIKAAESAIDTTIITYKKIPGIMTINNKDARNVGRIKYPQIKIKKSLIFFFL